MEPGYTEGYEQRMRLLKTLISSGFSNMEIEELTNPMRGKSDETIERMALELREKVESGKIKPYTASTSRKN